MMSPSSRTFAKILSVGADRPRGIFFAAGSGSGWNLCLRFFDGRSFGFGEGFSVQCEIALEDTNTLLGFECVSSSSLVVQFICWSKLSKNFKPCCCAVNEEFLHSERFERQMACNFA